MVVWFSVLPSAIAHIAPATAATSSLSESARLERGSDPGGACGGGLGPLGGESAMAGGSPGLPPPMPPAPSPIEGRRTRMLPPPMLPRSARIPMPGSASRASALSSNVTSRSMQPALASAF